MKNYINKEALMMFIKNRDNFNIKSVIRGKLKMKFKYLYHTTCHVQQVPQAYETILDEQ